MMSFGKWGMYDGQKVFFTHRNPKNGYVWSDDITYTDFERRGNKTVKVTRYGMWIASDKVKWL